MLKEIWSKVEYDKRIGKTSDQYKTGDNTKSVKIKYLEDNWRFDLITCSSPTSPPPQSLRNAITNAPVRLHNCLHLQLQNIFIFYFCDYV